jgi:hypothetical protein
VTRIYNGFVVNGQLSADQKRTLSMTKRSLERKGIVFGNVTKVSEALAPIAPEPTPIVMHRSATKAGPAGRRLTIEETAALNGWSEPVKEHRKPRSNRSRRPIVKRHESNKGGCFWGSAECKGRTFGKVGQKWHYSCAKGKAYSARMDAQRGS